jgi:hypothetical protein
MSRINLEYELIKHVSNYLKKEGYRLFYEIRIGYCIADIVAIKNETVMAVELKLRDWKKAIIQAKNYQLSADFVYLAFPLNRSFNVLKKAEHILKKENIGLLIIKEDNCEVRKIINAGKSKRKICSITSKEIMRANKRKITKRLPYGF